MTVFTTLSQIRELQLPPETEVRILKSVGKTKLDKTQPNMAAVMKFLKSVGTTKIEDLRPHLMRSFEPVSLINILDTCGLDVALRCIGAAKWNPKESRLFAVACARELQHSLKSQALIDVLDTMERFAQGDASIMEAIESHSAVETFLGCTMASSTDKKYIYTVADAALPDANLAATRAAYSFRAALHNDASDRVGASLRSPSNDVADAKIEKLFRKFFG